MAGATLIKGADYAPRIRAERLIAAGRVALAAFALLAVSLDPDTPSKHTETTQLVLIGYFNYATLVAAAFWLANVPLVSLGLATLAVDLALFSLLPYLTDDSKSLFFAVFSFSIVAATLRWQWRGALWTAVVALTAFNGIGIYAVVVLDRPEFSLNQFIIWSGYLAVLAGLLAYLGAHEERRRREMGELAAWPGVSVRDPELPHPHLLESAARILGAPRVLLVWEEQDESWLHIASWCDGELRSWREAPGTFYPVVAGPLAGLTFLSANVRAPMPSVLCLKQAELSAWRGAPIHSALQSRFAMRGVLCLPLHGGGVAGHLIALDKPRMTADDLLLGEVVGHQVAASIDQSLATRRLRRAAAVEERNRLSRDLHDGVLQSLTAAALQLQTVQGLWNTEPQVARERLTATQLLIAHEQMALRTFFSESKAAAVGPMTGDAGLRTGLLEVVQRIERTWGLRVVLELDEDHESPDPLATDMCLLVHEALANAARHAAATEVSVAVARDNGELRVVVTDNGHGFPFQGEYDFAALTALQLGPVTLKERVRSLGGTVAIHSTTAGARLDIRLPIPPGDD